MVKKSMFFTSIILLSGCLVVIFTLFCINKSNNNNLKEQVQLQVYENETLNAHNAGLQRALESANTFIQLISNSNSNNNCHQHNHKRHNHE